MKALVLGGTGFIGRWIVRELLERGYHVHILNRSPHQLQQQEDAKRVQYFVGDCSDSDTVMTALRECDVVFHAGAYYPVYSVNVEQQCKRALDDLRSVLGAARMSQISRLVFTSSPMVLVQDPFVLKHCAYHRIKHILHQEMLRAIENGLPGMLIVPGACFGPEDRKPATGRVIVEIASRRLRFVLDGVMNAVDVRDVAKGEVDAMEKAAIGSCYQLGNWNCSFADFAAVVAKLANIPVPHRHVPYEPTRTVAGIVEWLQYRAGMSLPLLPQLSLDQIRYGTHLDSSAAIRDLGYSVRPIEETIRETLDYFIRERYIKKDHRVNVPLKPQAQSISLCGH